MATHASVSSSSSPKSVLPASLPPNDGGGGKASAKIGAKPADQYTPPNPPTVFEKQGSQSASEPTLQTVQHNPQTSPTQDDKEVAELVRVTALTGNADQAAEILTAELETRDAAGQEALLEEVIETSPEALGLVLGYVGGTGEASSVIAETFGRVYEQRAAADPAAAQTMLEAVLTANEPRTAAGQPTFGSALEVGRAIALSGSEALQTAAVEVFLAQSAELAEAAGIDPGSAGSAAYTSQSRLLGEAAVAAAAGLDTAMGRSLTLLGSALAQADYRFSVSDLRLGFLDEAGWTALEQVLLGGSITVDQALGHIGTLQTYWGYDNQTMVSALREIYYPDLLDPFIGDAGWVGPEIHDLGTTPVDANGVSASEAAFAETILFLSRQGKGYASPIVDINPGTNRPGFPAEFGLDHVIAGLDGFFHPQQGPSVPYISAGIWLAGGDPGLMGAMDASTWLGDLGATVQIGLQQDGSLTTADRAAAGYALEMPFEDFHGDLMAFVVAQGLDPNGHDLAGSMAAAFDPNGAAWQNRYETFATAIGLTLDPVTGQITNRADFVAKWTDTVSAIGQGLAKDLGQVAGEVLGDGTGADALAEYNLEAFLDQIQAGLDANP